MRASLALLAVAAAATSGCDLSMSRQPRRETLQSADLWPGGPQARPAPRDSVPVDAPVDDDPTAARPRLTLALIERGRDRYRIYCAPCHGRYGEGDGPVVQRGFPRPPSYGEPRLRRAPAAHFVEVMTHGYGVMYAYSDRLPVADRWAVAAYVRALQLAQAEPGAPEARR